MLSLMGKSAGVRRDQFHDRALVVQVLPEGDVRLDGKMFMRAWQASRNMQVMVRLVINSVLECGIYFTHAEIAGYRLPIRFQHMKCFEDVLVLHRDHAGVDHVQPQLFNDGSDAAEQALLRSGIDENFGATALAVRFNIDQAAAVPVVLLQQSCVCRDLCGYVAQEIFVLELLPYCGIFASTEQIKRGRLD